MPPAFRTRSSPDVPRSLDDIVRRKGRGNLRAALFLIVENVEGHSENRAHCLDTVTKQAEKSALKDLRCEQCTQLHRESGDGACSDGNLDGDDTDNCWWTRLRQVTGKGVHSETGGLLLSLRPDDVGHPNGQETIMTFLGSLVESSFGRKDCVECESDYECQALSGSGEEEIEKETAQPKDECYSPDLQPPTRKVVIPEERDNSSTTKRGKRNCEETEVMNDTGLASTVVLVFDSRLSKIERAELHRLAESFGITSASHGTGGERFLALAAGYAGAIGQETQLSVNEEELSWHLFQWAQEEYHSCYEQISLAEIREVVAAGGPCSDIHPELFSLLQKRGQQQQQLGV
ncbi:unnamed protein product [Choristocarpus tenellus]